MQIQSWMHCGHEVTLLVTEDRAARPAARLLRAALGRVERVADPRLGSAEVYRATRARGRTVPAGALLRRLLDAALDGAALTAGRFDVTVGTSTLFDPRPGTSWLPEGPARQAQAPRPAPGAGAVSCGAGGWSLRPGTVVDLRPVATAVCAAETARRIAEDCGTGVLVRIGGDTATAGPRPWDGWSLPGEPLLPGGVAGPDVARVTPGSSCGGIVDPATGRHVAPHWASLAVADRAAAPGGVVTGLGLPRLKALAVAAATAGPGAAQVLQPFPVVAVLTSTDGRVHQIGADAAPPAGLAGPSARGGGELPGQRRPDLPVVA